MSIKQPSWRTRSDSATCLKDSPEDKTGDQRATAHLDVPAGHVAEDDSKSEPVLSKKSPEGGAANKINTEHVLSEACPEDKPLSEPENEIKKAFMAQPNELLFRETFYPQHPLERAWKYASLSVRQGLDPLNKLIDTPEDEQIVEDLRHTLEKFGAFFAPHAKKEMAHAQVPEKMLLRKWEKASSSLKLRTDAPEFVPAGNTISHSFHYPSSRPTSCSSDNSRKERPRMRLGHEMAVRAIYRKSREQSMESLYRVKPDPPKRTLEASLGQYVILKRPKRMSQQAEGAW